MNTYFLALVISLIVSIGINIFLMFVWLDLQNKNDILKHENLKKLFMIEGLHAKANRNFKADMKRQMAEKDFQEGSG